MSLIKDKTKKDIDENNIVAEIGAVAKEAVDKALSDVVPTAEDSGVDSSKKKLVTKRRFEGHKERGERIKPEFEQKILSIRRVTRVTAGGKRFNISIAIVLGNGKGQVGVGIGKGADTALALEKAVRDAKKKMINVNVNKNMSIPHDVKAKYSSSVVALMPAPKRGLVVGSAARDVLQIAGIRDVVGKIYSRSTNKLNIARATILALSKLSKPKDNK
jgi:small subunit ribosomal protein S5